METLKLGKVVLWLSYLEHNFESFFFILLVPTLHD
jgi:hypothetical protein